MQSIRENLVTFCPLVIHEAVVRTPECPHPANRAIFKSWAIRIGPSVVLLGIPAIFLRVPYANRLPKRAPRDASSYHAIHLGLYEK